MALGYGVEGGCCLFILGGSFDYFISFEKLMRA